MLYICLLAYVLTINCTKIALIYKYNCQLRLENMRTPFKQVTFFPALISKRPTMSFSRINDVHIAHAQSMKEEKYPKKFASCTVHVHTYEYVGG